MTRKELIDIVDDIVLRSHKITFATLYDNSVEKTNEIYFKKVCASIVSMLAQQIPLEEEKCAPCPFCGCPDVETKLTPISTTNEFTCKISCSKCYASVSGVSPEMALWLWNRRTPQNL